MVENPYAQLVNVTSSQDGSWKRVVPNDATNSLLCRKVNDVSPPVGSRMPSGGVPLSQGQIDTICNWILQTGLNK